MVEVVVDTPADTSNSGSATITITQQHEEPLLVVETHQEANRIITEGRWFLSVRNSQTETIDYFDRNGNFLGRLTQREEQ